MEAETARWHRPAARVDPLHFALGVERDGGGVVVRVHGELDDYTTPRLCHELAALDEQRPQRIVVDLGEASFVAPAALSAFLAAQRSARRYQGDIVLRSPRPSTRKLLEMTGLAGVIVVS